jgi:CheY-like chemotaxis protein
VTVESDGVRRGTTFTVRLPAAAPEAPSPADLRTATIAAAAAEAPPSPARDFTSLHGVTVLVTDDDEQSREIVAEYLQSHHARVHTASSVAQAFDLLQREHIDVLLADIAMPGEDGYSLIRKLRSSGISALAATPAAALTSLARDEDRQHAIQAGFHLHLAKPIDPQRLVDAVAELAKLHVAQPDYRVEHHQPT